MTITSLVDDHCPKRGFLGEHGLSILVESRGKRVLFDTGQTDAFLKNAKRLGIDLSGIDAVVLSHGHYDHGGGLPALYRDYPAPQLFVGSGCMAARGSVSAAGRVDIGLAEPLVPPGSPHPRVVTAPLEIVEGVYLLPAAGDPATLAFDPRFRKFEGERAVVDDFSDELSLLVQGEDGAVLISGCAHRGIVEIARDASKRFPGSKFRAIVGGFHLVDAAPERRRDVARGIAAMDPAAVFCSHCTGLDGYAALAAELPGRVTWLYSGRTAEF
jgi:7,8-dihydropterin-6-yl-methyl-4-(beta-D-ribofuranosyl)aminobenzene 5'-phosphate synthase